MAKKNEIVTGKIGKKENIEINIKNISSWTYSATNSFLYSLNNKYAVILSMKPKRKDVIGEPCPNNDESEIIVYPGIYSCKIEELGYH